MMESKPLDYGMPKPREPLLFSAMLSLAVGIACGPLAYALALLAVHEEKEWCILPAIFSLPAISLLICIVSLGKVIPKEKRRSIRFVWASLAITIVWGAIFYGMISSVIPCGSSYHSGRINRTFRLYRILRV